MRCSLQEEGHPLPRQAAEAAHPRRGGGFQAVSYQELEDPISLQVELGSVELLRGLDAGSDEPRAAAAGAHHHGGQARRQGEAQGSFGIKPVQCALGAVERDLLHAALLLGQTAVSRRKRERRQG